MAQMANLQNLVADAVGAVEFKLVRSPQDVNDESKSFPPEMAHQIFGENENIFGYKDLKISIMYTAGPLQIYVGIKYTNRVDDFMQHGLKADDVMGAISEKLPNGFHTNIDAFLKTLSKAKDFKPFGEKLTEYIADDKFGKKRHFEIYQSDESTPNFCNFFERLQTLVLWFVDAATYVDTDDPQWTYFVCYEKYKNELGETLYASVGYTTVYEYYAFPENIRPRISQMLILPPFQKMGIGSKIIETIYQYFVSNNKVIDITVEDPSDDFQRMRNYVDAKLCMDLPAFRKDVIKNGYTQAMAKQARDKLKINPRQCRKIYEILRLLHTNVNNAQDYKSYRLDIKKRLNLIHYKHLQDIEKLKKAGNDTAWMVAALPSHEERLEQLKAEYEEVESEYEKIVERLVK